VKDSGMQAQGNQGEDVARIKVLLHKSYYQWVLKIIVLIHHLSLIESKWSYSKSHNSFHFFLNLRPKFHFLTTMLNSKLSLHIQETMTIRTAYLPSWGFLTTRYMWDSNPIYQPSLGSSKTWSGPVPPESTVRLQSSPWPREYTLLSPSLHS
jgi:hypothetical protein